MGGARSVRIIALLTSSYSVLFLRQSEASRCFSFFFYVSKQLFDGSFLLACALGHFNRIYKIPRRRKITNSRATVFDAWDPALSTIETLYLSCSRTSLVTSGLSSRLFLPLRTNSDVAVEDISKKHGLVNLERFLKLLIEF